MNKPLISVLMPAYNAEKYIEESIQSILDQNFKDYEFIILDDSSTDNTWNIIQSFAKKDKRIVPLRNPKNLDIAGSRNKLISKAKGKYIAWQDADDISLPKRIEHQFHFLEKNKSVGIVGGFLQFFNDKGVTGIRKYSTNDYDLRKSIFRFSPVAQPAAMIRKEYLEECGKYNGNYTAAEDLDMSFRIGLYHQFANLNEIVLQYRQNKNSATYTNLKKMEENSIAIRKKYSIGYGYYMTISDRIYNRLQELLINNIDPAFKIKIFNLIRNKK
jgi:glycosyltransferase involved in cell wall biosynthesis